MVIVGWMLAAVLGLGSSSHAQEADAREAEPHDWAANGVDARRLPVSLERLQQGLRESVEREQRDGLELQYHIDVFGQAPRIEIFRPGEDLVFAPASYGAPTHQDMWELWTPREFRSPVMDFSNLIRWLRERSNGDRRGR